MSEKIKSLYYKGTNKFIAFFLEGEKQERYILFGKISGFIWEQMDDPILVKYLKKDIQLIPKSFIELKTNFIKDKESDGLYWMIKIKDAQEFESMYKILECIWHE